MSQGGIFQSDKIKTMPLPLLAIAAGASTAIDLGSAIFGKTRQAKKQRAYNRWLDRQQTKLDAWYNKEKNTKYLDTAEGSQVYNGMRKLLKDRSNMVDNSLVKTGGTTESKLAANQQANDTLSTTANSLAAQDTARKQHLSSQYNSQNGQIQNMRAGNMQAGIAGSSNTFNNAVSSLGGSMTSLFTEIASKRKA